VATTVRRDAYIAYPTPRASPLVATIYDPHLRSMPLSIDLTGQHVLVTGASRGIGRAVATTLADAGATVGVHYGVSRGAAEELASSIGGHPFRADLGDPAAVRRLFTEALDTFGRLDGLVNNAGVAIHAPLDAPDEEWTTAWDHTMAVNLRAAGQLCRAAVRHFAERAEEGRIAGRIVNVASRAAFRGDTPDYLAYAASKAGLVALTRSIARGCGRQGVVAFTVAPGFTRTEMAQPFLDAYGADYATHDIALGRMTEPEDVAPTVAFLLSGLADHATGATIDVNAASYVR
jgi:3-oxoacyl-[acyl-carrier protein] reductase